MTEVLPCNEVAAIRSRPTDGSGALGPVSFGSHFGVRSRLAEELSLIFELKGIE